MPVALRCKMRVESVEGGPDSEQVKLRAVYENRPDEFSITIKNPSACGKLLNGHEFYVEFTPVAK